MTIFGRPSEAISSLAGAAAAGDCAAKTELLQAVWPDAYRIAWSILRERTAAEDAAQEACARVLIPLPTLRRPEAFALWFYRIVVNESKRSYGRRRRDGALGEHVPQDDGGAREADQADVRRAVASLAPTLRIAVVLHYFFGLTSSEIARVVQTSPVTVRWRLMVARRRLRSLLEAPVAPLKRSTPITKAPL